MDHTIIENLETINTEIATVFAYYFLEPRAVNIIAVSKNHTAEHIMPLLKAGHRVFGENKVMEAIEKWTPLKALYPDIELHLIGALQSNKVKKALTIFDVIQTIDRPSLIDELVKYPDIIKDKKFFIQVNTGHEDQKSGVTLTDFASLLAYAKDKLLPISGLMCIPPIHDNAVHHFTVLQSLVRQNGARQNGGLKMSAGMSADFDKAIIAGTDYIRIGTALFGKREAV
ncbi:MAG: pyridoxal phosphate enzyme (YggS family) [Alphaproteobacteria bacterium]|jgi:pyridoxal phosphate enzyme (YggS family)